MKGQRQGREQVQYPSRTGRRLVHLYAGLALYGASAAMLHRRTGRSMRPVRGGIEVNVLAAGFALGGAVGVGTVAYALAIGPLAQFFLRVFAIADPPARRGTAVTPDHFRPVIRAKTTTLPE